MAQRPHSSNNSLGRTGTTQEDIDDFEEDPFDEQTTAAIKSAQDQYSLVTSYTRRAPKKPSSKNIGVEIDIKGSCHNYSDLDSYARSGYSRELNKFGTNVSMGGNASSIPDVLDLGMTKAQKKRNREDLKAHLLRNQVNKSAFYGNSRNLGIYYQL